MSAGFAAAFKAEKPQTRVVLAVLKIERGYGLNESLAAYITRRSEIEAAYAAQLSELAATVVPPEQLGALAEVWAAISKETSILADVHASLATRFSSLPQALQHYSKSSSEWAKVKEHQAELLKVATEMEEIENKDPLASSNDSKKMGTLDKKAAEQHKQLKKQLSKCEKDMTDLFSKFEALETARNVVVKETLSKMYDAQHDALKSALEGATKAAKRVAQYEPKRDVEAFGLLQNASAFMDGAGAEASAANGTDDAEEKKKKKGFFRTGTLRRNSTLRRQKSGAAETSFSVDAASASESGFFGAAPSPVTPSAGGSTGGTPASILDEPVAETVQEPPKPTGPSSAELAVVAPPTDSAYAENPFAKKGGDSSDSDSDMEEEARPKFQIRIRSASEATPEQTPVSLEADNSVLFNTVRGLSALSTLGGSNTGTLRGKRRSRLNELAQDSDSASSDGLSTPTSSEFASLPPPPSSASASPVGNGVLPPPPPETALPPPPPEAALPLPPPTSALPPPPSSATVALSSPTAFAADFSQMSATPSDAIPITAHLVETVNCVFTGGTATKMAVTGELRFTGSMTAEAMNAIGESFIMRLDGGQYAEKIAPNTALAERIGESIDFRINARALLREFAAGAPVIVLKYHYPSEDPADILRHVPMSLAVSWKRTDNMTGIAIQYDFVNKAAGKAVRDISFLVSVDGGVTNAQSKPSGLWNPEKGKMLWKIGDSPQGTSASGKVMGRFDVAQQSSPSPVAVKFTVEDATVLDITPVILPAEDSPSAPFALTTVKRNMASGKYLAD